MAVLNTIWNIIVFLLCLSIVVCIHEAGHLAVAKICKVYCFEYSIGFGPLIYKHKFKHKKKGNKQALTDGLNVIKDQKAEKEEGETQLSIRALPLGGYVAMAGEDGNVDENGRALPKERCLNGVNHFKQICIMLAGIAMNFLLAFLLFFGSALAPQTKNVLDTNSIVVSETTKDDGSHYAAYNAGLRTGDKLTSVYQVFENLHDKEGNKIQGIEFPAVSERVTLTGYQEKKPGVTDASTYNDITTSSIAYATMDIFTVHSNDMFDYKGTLYEDFENYVLGPDSARIIHFTYIDAETNETVTAATDLIFSVADESDKNNVTYSFDLFGISCQTETVHYSVGQAFTMGGQYFSNLFVGLYSALGSLFTPSGWKNVGGIVSVYKMSAEGTSSGSLSYILLLWGYISLNLGCFNLLPFPGLDGWQTLMALIESIIRRKLPPKFKNVANSVGMIILFVLAGLLVIKDIIMF